MPKSLGGLDDADNLVKLTAKEHFICHALLIRFLTGHAKYKMEWAFHQLCTWSPKSSAHKDVYVNSRLYEKFKQNFQKGANNSQYGVFWWTNIDTFEQLKSKTCPGDRYVRGRKTRVKEDAKRLQKEKMQHAKNVGLIRADGHINGNGITTNEWLKRKNMILQSGVDLTTFGWVGKVVNITGLSKHVIENTVKRFDELKQICYYRK